MTEAVIVAAARTPIGRAAKGSLVDERPEDLALAAIRGALDAAPGFNVAEIDDLLLGCGLPGGVQGNNLGRVIAVLGGYDALPATTVTRYCASSLQTTRMAFHAIRAGEGGAFLSVGVESVSSTIGASSDLIPGHDLGHQEFASARARTASRTTATTAPPWADPRAGNELPDIYIPMGQTAENLADRYHITRADQDAYALRSQQRTRDADSRGFWQREITPYTTTSGVEVTRDDSPRPTSTAEGLAGLAPVFRPNGSVTAGNSCPLNDGAAALLIMSDEEAQTHGLRPLARIVSTGVGALSPEIMGIGPVQATARALSSAGMTLADVDLIELNEAYAAQVLACVAEIGLDEDRLNVNGGAIAIGHPYGMTGNRLLVTLLNGLRERDEEVGMATLCAAGGQGMSVIVERMSN
jgi:acetyl-CoA C-acetyltransferase